MITNKEQLYALAKKNTMLNDQKLSFLASGIKYIVENKIEGDIVECGVWMGGTDVFLSSMLLDHKDERIFRLFDSFEDPPEPLPEDGPWVAKKLGLKGNDRVKGRLLPIKGFYKRQTKVGPGNAKHVYNMLLNDVGYPKEKIKIYKGWFQNTIVKYSQRIDKIALLILDCDFYESIKICIENLYSKMSPSGILFIDDYAPQFAGCKKAIDDYFVDKATNKEPKIINGTSFEEYACLNGGNIFVRKV